MNLLPIGEVARQTGLRPSAIRYYEAEGVLATPVRLSGRRRYGPEVIRAIGVIRFAQDAGFTLQGIKVLLRGPAPERGLGARWRRLAGSKLEELDALADRVSQMRRAIKAGLRCDCAGVEDCMLSGVVGASTKARIPRTMRRSIAAW
jgi:MerR family transcriptional regulator, redox-sensitive transcriptional activator SoxR